jgi:hypothetical protein
MVLFVKGVGDAAPRIHTAWFPCRSCRESIEHPSRRIRSPAWAGPKSVDMGYRPNSTQRNGTQRNGTQRGVGCTPAVSSLPLSSLCHIYSHSGLMLCLNHQCGASKVAGQGQQSRYPPAEQRPCPEQLLKGSQRQSAPVQHYE